MDNEIIANWVAITPTTNLKEKDIIACWEYLNGEKHSYIQHLITDIKDNLISTEKIIASGLPFKKEKRTKHTFSVDTLVNKFRLLQDKTNDRRNWPTNLEEAITKLEITLNKNDLKKIRQLSWDEFQKTFFGLGEWIRNNFGLWRGNVDLLLSCNLDTPDADGASYYILYHFWEYVTKKNN